MPATLKVDLRTIQPPARTSAASAAQSNTSSDFMAELGKARKEIEPIKYRAAEKPAETEKPEAKAATSKKKAAESRKPRRENGDEEEAIEPTAAKPTERARPKDEAAAADDVEAVATSDVEPEATEETEPTETDEPNLIAAQLAVAVNTTITALEEAVTANAVEGDPDAALEGDVIEALLGDGSNGSPEAAVDDAGEAGAIVLPEGIEDLADDELPAEITAKSKAPGERGTRGDEDDAARAEIALADASQSTVIDDAATNVVAGAVQGIEAAVAKASLVADSDLAAGLMNNAAQPAPTPVADAKAAAPAQPLPPEVQFARANHEKIVTGMSGQLMPNGGTMQIRLDPPHLGPLQVSVHLRDGVLTAAFETQNDEATKLLSHSLNQLKNSLESQGITVDKLQVQQAPKSESTNSNAEDQRSGQQQQNGREALTDQQNQKQRQEMLKRMWQRLNGDPLDLVA